MFYQLIALPNCFGAYLEETGTITNKLSKDDGSIIENRKIVALGIVSFLSLDGVRDSVYFYSRKFKLSFNKKVPKLSKLHLLLVKQQPYGKIMFLSAIGPTCLLGSLFYFKKPTQTLFNNLECTGRIYEIPGSTPLGCF